MIRNDARVHVARQGLFDLRKALFHILRRCDRVLTRLFRYHERDGGYTIEPRRGRGLLIAVFGVTYITDLDDVAIAVGDRDFIELRRVGNAAGGADGKVFRAFFEAATGQFQILRSERIEYVGHGEVIGAKLIGIDRARESRAWLRPR